MKNKLLKVSVIALAIILLLQVVSLAAIEKLTLKISTDKDTYKIGDKVVVTVDWTEIMESGEVFVLFDSTKLEFKNVTDSDGKQLSEDNYNLIEEGKAKLGWAGTKASKMLFVFEAKAEGTTTISLNNPDGFGCEINGGLLIIEDYDITAGTKSITINAKTQEPTTPDKQEPETQEPITPDEQEPEIQEPETQKPSTPNEQEPEKIDTKRYISFPFIIYNGSSSVELKSGVYDGQYSMYYQFVEVSDEVFNKLSDLNEKYRNDELTYEEYFVQYNNTVTKYDDSKWTKTEDGSFKKDLNEFKGSKKFALWVKLVMTDKTVYESQIYTMNGSGTASNVPESADKIDAPTTAQKDNTTASGKMPQTGIETTVVFAILTLAILGTVGFVGYRRLSDI